MNYYNRHVGDYARDTAHLSLAEDGAYNRMLDLYYIREEPLPKLRPVLYRLLRARSKADQGVIDVVLSEFFEEREGGWHHKRCDEEISAYQIKAERNRQNGMKGGRPIKPNDNPKITHSVSNENPNITLASSQKPIANNQESTRAGRASRFKLTEIPIEWLEFCKKERPELNYEKVFALFIDHWRAASGQRALKLDWFATWRNWVRKENNSYTSNNKINNKNQAIKSNVPRGTSSDDPTRPCEYTDRVGAEICGITPTMLFAGKPMCLHHIEKSKTGHGVPPPIPLSDVLKRVAN